jgi:glycosyltransferase involved in cell wall biosynthesis
MVLVQQDRPPSPFDVSIMFPIANWGWATADACNQLARHMQPLVRRLTVHSPVTGNIVKDAFLDSVVPGWVPDYVKGKLCQNATAFAYLQAANSKRAISRLSPGSICWTFPPTPVDFVKRAKDRGSKIVLEFINTHTSYSTAVLKAEYARTGRVWSDSARKIIESEDDDRLALADAVFTPGVLIGPSITQYCMNPPPLMPVSYGAPFRPPPKDLDTRRVARKFVFIGFDGFRKGLHILLEAWARAGIDGELIIVGGVDPWIRAQYGHLIDHRVKVIDISHDLDRILADSDVFVLPSVEEGDPLSTYLAASHGLPLVVTRVAGGCIARDGVNACIVEPANSDALATALVSLAEDGDLFAKMRRQSYQSSLQFTWEAAAKHRHSELERVFGRQ